MGRRFEMGKLGGRWFAGICALALLWASSAGAFCFEEAGQMYQVPPSLLFVIASNESGLDPAAVGRNANGTYDVGLMQINSSWKSRLGEQRWKAVFSDPCYNVKVGAWLLADCLSRYGYTWQGIGCYNAMGEVSRAKYAVGIIKKIDEIKGMADATD